MHGRSAAQVAAAFGILGLAQMPPASAGTQDFASGSDLKAFGHGFLRLDAFGSSHKLIRFLSQKERRI
jgi:hypothetical protein